jgi:tetratricopeptide (TPR) repeat protein
MLNIDLAADQEVRTAAEQFKLGNRAAAERGCRSVLGLHPKHADANALLGVILLTERRFDEAEVIFDGLSATAPEPTTNWINLGIARRGARKFDTALTAFAHAASLGASTADFYYNVGLTHIDRLDFESARAVLEKAVTLAPQDAEIRYRYALACFESRRQEETLRALADWTSLSGLTSELAAYIGTLFMNLGHAAEAEQAFAIAAQDPNADPYVSLAIIEALERINRLDDARRRIELLKRDPRAAELGVDLLLTEAQLAEREGRFEQACELRQRVLREITEFHRRHFQLFRLAKNLDSAKRYEEAFATLREAHESQIAYFKLTVPAFAVRGVMTMEITRYDCEPADVARWDLSDAPSLAESPIFIVAFPRSGTTLLELTLDSHASLRSMDEQPFLQSALQRLGANGVQYPEQLAQVSNTDLKAIRAAYWQSVAEKVALGSGQRLVDKNPLNILRLPVISRLFPHARILLAVRHPCDVLLSNYIQHFRSPDYALLCADLATVTAGYRRTMDFWYRNVEILKPPVLEVRYESFVADIGAQTREICEFLQIPWDESMLVPGTNARKKGFISTPSYSQVVQSVNQKAVGRWQSYKAHFEPMLPVLEPYLNRWGYST